MNVDLISRDEVLRMLKFKKHWCYGSGSMNDIDKVMQDIKNLPTVDAEPVVHCKDCKHSCFFKRSGSRHCKVHPNYTFLVKDNDYCSHGAKMDGDKGD